MCRGETNDCAPWKIRFWPHRIGLSKALWSGTNQASKKKITETGKPSSCLTAVMKQCDNLRHISDSSYKRGFLSFNFWSGLFFSAERCLIHCQWHYFYMLKIDTKCRLVFWTVKWQYCLLESQYNVIWCAVHPKVALLKICTSELKIIAIVRTKKVREKHDEHDKQYMHKRIIEKCLRNHCYRGKALSITYSECVSAA